MYLIYCTFRDCSCTIRILCTLYRRHFKKILIILLHKMCIDACKLGISDCGKNVIIYQSHITRVSGNTPLVMSIYLHIFFNQFFQCCTLLNLKFSDRLLVLNFFFPFICFFLRSKCFRCCMFFSILIQDFIYHRVCLSPVPDKCHVISLLPCAHSTSSGTAVCEPSEPFRLRHTGILLTASIW